MSLIASRVGPRIRLRGLAAEYVKEDLDAQEAQLLAGMRPGDPGFGVEPEAHWGRLYRPDGTSHPVATEPGRYLVFYELLRDAVRGQGPVPVEPLDSLQTLRVIEAAERAAAPAPSNVVGGIGMATSIGIGLVGAGRMGAILARAIAREVPGARLVAIADRDRAAALRLADELRVDAVFDSADELVARPDVTAVSSLSRPHSTSTWSGRQPLPA